MEAPTFNSLERQDVASGKRDDRRINQSSRWHVHTHTMRKGNGPYERLKNGASVIVWWCTYALCDEFLAIPHTSHARFYVILEGEGNEETQKLSREQNLRRVKIFFADFPSICGCIAKFLCEYMS